MPLYLTEEDVEAVFTIGDALEAVEGSFRRQAAGEIENRPRDRLRLEEGALAVMAAADLGLGVAGVKTYAAGAGGVKFVVVLFDAARHDLLAVIEADQLGRLRTGAASGVAAKHLAKEGAASLGVIGCGHQAETQVAAIRAALPDIATTVVYCRDAGRREAFANAVGADSAESHQEAAAQDVVVTITTSKDPVLRGEWLRPGALVCAAGREHRAQPGARQRRAGARCLRVLRLPRQRKARVRRPHRARRTRSPRLARGARAGRGRRRRRPGAAVG